MTFTINHCLVAGRISDFGVKLTYTPNGKPELSFVLILERPGEHKVYRTYVPVRCFGSQVESLAESLDPLDLVLIDGQLGYRGERSKDATDRKSTGQLAVTCFNVEVLQRADVAQAST